MSLEEHEYHQIGGVCSINVHIFRSPIRSLILPCELLKLIVITKTWARVLEDTCVTEFAEPSVVMICESC